jgi:initiation factor 1A
MSYQSSIRNKKNNKSFNKNKQMNYNIDENLEEYGFISKMLGNCRCLVISNSNLDCIGTICGSLRKFNKRILIEKGDIVIITKPVATNTKVTITYKLNTDQVSNLINDNIISDRLINLYNNRCTTIDDKEINDLNELTFTDDIYTIEDLK